MQSGGQAKAHRSACEISRETGIPRSSVHGIILRDGSLAQMLQTHRAQLLSEASRVDRLSR